MTPLLDQVEPGQFEPLQLPVRERWVQDHIRVKIECLFEASRHGGQGNDARLQRSGGRESRPGIEQVVFQLQGTAGSCSLFEQVDDHRVQALLPSGDGRLTRLDDKLQRHAWHFVPLDDANL